LRLPAGAAADSVAVVGLRSIHPDEGIDCTVALAVQLVERTVEVLLVHMVEEEDWDSRWTQVGVLRHRRT